MDVSDGATARAEKSLTTWDFQTIHRTATTGDAAGAEWLMGQVKKLGATPKIQ